MKDKIATVSDLINHLENNFKSTDLLSWFDEGGAWCEVYHLYRSQIGTDFFKYVKTMRNDRLVHEAKDNQELKDLIISEYKNVDDNDVVIY